MFHIINFNMGLWVARVCAVGGKMLTDRVSFFLVHTSGFTNTLAKLALAAEFASGAN